MTRKLTQFTVADDGVDYLLHIEDDAGEMVSFSATYDQLDVIVEAIDRHLDEDAEQMDEAEE